MRPKWILLIFIIFPSISFGADTTECIDGDCLENGWVTKNSVGRTQQVIKCSFFDCKSGGWEIYRDEWDVFPLKEIRCDFMDCFRDGWKEYVYRTGRLIQIAECVQQDCLRYGWDVRQNGRVVIQTRCESWDCPGQGWYTRNYVRNQSELIRCTNGKCFENGWKIYP